MTTPFRITHRSLQRSTLAGLESNVSRLQRLQEQLSSGREIQRPSDSPVGTVSAMQLRANQRATEQLRRNAQDGLNWLGTADDTLTSMLGTTGRVRELMLRGMNASMGPSERSAIAAELDTLHQTLVSLANTKYLDRPIFAGTSDSALAYAADGSYVGNVGDDTAAATIGKVMRTVAVGVTVRVNLTGPEVFGPSGADLFATVAAIADHLRNDPSALGADLTQLDAQVSALHDQLAKIGARYNQVEIMRDRADDQLLVLRQGLSEVEDIDIPRTIVDLQLQEVAYKAALSATSRVIQPSLLDFLR
jgi:flagellar hook-associated protein 3 FlgL